MQHSRTLAHHAEASLGKRAASRVLDDPDELVHPIALAAGELDELTRARDDSALLGRPGDRDATAAAELEQSLVAQHAKRT